jgi:N6-L-threonylcarbamoyladenine synthase
MLYEKNYDFSFSGLKTAVLYDYKKRKESERTSPEYITEMSKEIQNAIIEVLLKKTIKAVQQYKAKSIILGGGVSANEILRSEIKKACQSLKIKCFLPKNEHTVDNASMIALAAAISPKPKIYLWKKIKPNPNFRL